jgi:putative inorganic carbon (hco3(-)) transporter
MKNIATWLVRLEIPALFAIYLFFILTDTLPFAAILLIIGIWLLRAWIERKFTSRTPFDLPIILLLVLLPFNLAISPNLFLSLPKIFGLLLGALIFYAIVNHISTEHDLQRSIFWLVLLASGIALGGLIGTDWAQGKIVSATMIYDRLPRVIQGIPRSIAGGFARNGIGGTLAFTVPLLASLLYSAFESTSTRTQSLTNQVKNGLGITSYRADPFVKWLPVLVLGTLLLSIAALALTQSRGGLLGTMIGLLVLLIWKKRRIGLLILAIGLLTAVLVSAFGSGHVIASALSDGTLASRLEVWQRGILMVEDFPITGIGIGTYNQVAHALYPFYIAAPDELVPHAHNQFLEVAVDLGIPGLVIYLGLLGVFFIGAGQALRAASDSSICALVGGLTCGMIAHHVFGLTDAFILGSKPGLLMWIYFAVIAGCYKVYVEQKSARSKSPVIEQ